MNTSQRSIYRDLLDHCYEAGSIPGDQTILARMAAVPQEEFDAAWPIVGKKFVPHPELEGRLTNPRVIEELAYREAKSRAGEAGGKAKARASKTLAGASSKTLAGASSKTLAQSQKHSTAEQNRENPSSPAEPDEGLLLQAEEQAPNLNDQQTRWFNDLFWPAYWRPVDKADALKTWKRHAASEARALMIVEAVKAHAPVYLKREPEHRPHASTWLNKLRYEEPPERLGGQPSTGRRDPFIEAAEILRKKRAG